MLQYFFCFHEQTYFCYFLLLAVRFVNSCLLQFSIIDHITDAKVRCQSLVFEIGSGGEAGVSRGDVRENRCNFELSKGEMPKKACINPVV